MCVCVCVCVCVCLGSGPCLEEMIRGWSRQTKSEDQFNNLVGVVSSAVHHAKADHQHTTIKVSTTFVVLNLYTYTQYIMLLAYAVSYIECGFNCDECQLVCCSVLGSKDPFT